MSELKNKIVVCMTNDLEKYRENISKITQEIGFELNVFYGNTEKSDNIDQVFNEADIFVFIVGYDYESSTTYTSHIREVEYIYENAKKNIKNIVVFCLDEKEFSNKRISGENEEKYKHKVAEFRDLLERDNIINNFSVLNEYAIDKFFKEFKRTIELFLQNNETELKEVLLDTGQTKLSIAVTQEPWLLGKDAFTILSDRSDSLSGELSTNFKKCFNEEQWDILKNEIDNELKNPDSSNKDVVIHKIPETWLEGNIVPKHVIVTRTNEDIKEADFDVAFTGIGTAINAVTGKADEHAFKDIVIPLINGNSIFSIEKTTNILEDIVNNLPFRVLTDIVITTSDTKLYHLLVNDKESIEEIWGEKFKVAPGSVAGMTNDAVQKDKNDKSETLLDEDSLDFERQVDGFARLLVAKDIQPPVSIGLFGQWGMGKSYFMGMIRERINQLVSNKINVDDEDEDESYVSRVCQIEFNAWHYVDTNLWACLAKKIFDDLADEIKDTLVGNNKDEGDTHKAWRLLRSKIVSSSKHRTEAGIQLAIAKEKRDKLSDTLADKRQDRVKEIEKKKITIFDDIKGKLSDHNKKSFLSAVAFMKRYIDTGTISYRNNSESKQINLNEFNDLFNDLKQLKRNSKSLLNFFKNNVNWYNILIVCVALFVITDYKAILEIFLDEPLEPYKSTVSEFFNNDFFSRFLCGGSSISYLLYKYIKPFLSINKALTTFESVHDKYKINIENESIELTEKIDVIDNEIDELVEKIEIETGYIKDAESEMRRIDNGGLVYDYLIEKSHDQVYLNELGLISTIRQDFEKLKELLDGWDNGKNPVKRIILYIDDLDRCEPNQVVDVLQAVHLLLAMDLFNVVVGVDPRWLEKSLNEKYRNQRLKSNDELNIVQSNNVFSAHNYLEKIFQIPFSVPRMNEDGYKCLVDDLVTTRTEHEIKAKIVDEVESEIKYALILIIRRKMKNIKRLTDFDNLLSVIENKILSNRQNKAILASKLFSIYKKKIRGLSASVKNNGDSQDINYLKIIGSDKFDKELGYIVDEWVNNAVCFVERVESDVIVYVREAIRQYIIKQKNNNNPKLDDINENLNDKENQNDIVDKYTLAIVNLCLLELKENKNWGKIQINPHLEREYNDKIEKDIREYDKGKYRPDKKTEDESPNTVAVKKVTEINKSDKDVEAEQAEQAEHQNSVKSSQGELKVDKEVEQKFKEYVTKVTAQKQSESNQVSIVLEDWEQDYMQLFHEFIKSPRMVKRFTNIYQLLRSQTAFNGNLADFVKVEYKVVQTLLAINIGFPFVSMKLLNIVINYWAQIIKVEEDKGNDVDQEAVYKEKDNKQNPDKKNFIELIDSVIKVEKGDDEKNGESKFLEITITKENIEELKKIYTLIKNIDSRPDNLIVKDIELYFKWARQVGRYSFKWHSS